MLVATPLTDRLMLLYLTGRKTGRAYRQPVSYVSHGDVLLTPGGGNWKLNLVPGRAERIRLRGRDVLARPEIISDVDEIEQLLAVITAANPTVRRFVGARQGTRRAARPPAARDGDPPWVPDHLLAHRSRRSPVVLSRKVDRS